MTAQDFSLGIQIVRCHVTLLTFNIAVAWHISIPILISVLTTATTNANWHSVLVKEKKR